MDEYSVEIPDWGEVKVKALDARMAAEVGVEKYERTAAEYSVASGTETIEVIVRWGRDRMKRFIVGGDLIPHYFARSVK